MPGDDAANDPALHGPGHNRPAEGVHHVWKALRNSRSLRAGILEPAEYKPIAHSELFNAVMTQLLGPQHTARTPSSTQMGDALDLLTCPEAFVPADTLLETLQALLPLGRSPCVHAGLRPSSNSKSHLFTYNQLETLVESLRNLSEKIREDLAPFAAWLGGASSSGYYNVATVFMVDDTGDLRVALHPKNTPASAEISALPENNLAQADFTVVVTLISSRGIMPVNIQPLICSDALDLPRDTHRPGPMAVLSSDPERLGDHPPDHIDIVSVAACTPQKNEASHDAPRRLTWQPKFRDAFVAMMDAAAYARHRFALTILANPRHIERTAGGLSGCFAPLPLPTPPAFGDGARVWSYGRFDRDDNCWKALEKTEGDRSWSSLAHLVALDPDNDSTTEDRLLVFTIPSFPRDRPRHDTSAAFSAIEIRTIGCITGRRDDDQEGNVDE